MFSIFFEVTELLGYSQELEERHWDMWGCSIIELSGFIAQTDPDPDGYFEECNRIDQAIKSLGYEI